MSDKCYMVMAGAGAGKTTSLVKHIVENFLSFKEKNGRWPRIIGTTFTKKAASEIQDRVSLLHKTYNDLEVFDFAYSNNLNIGTVHSLCLQLLRQKSNLLGFGQDLKVFSSEKFDFIKKKILSQLLNDEYSDLLNYYGFNEISKIISYFENHKEFDLKPITLDGQIVLLNERIEKFYSDFSSNFRKITASDLDGIKNGPSAYYYLKSLDISIEKSKSESDLVHLYNFFNENKFTKPRFSLSKSDLENIWENLWVIRNQIKDDVLDNYFKFYDKSSFVLLEKNSFKIREIYKLFSKKLIDYKRQESVIEMSDIESLTLTLLVDFKDKCEDFINQWDFYYIDEYQDTNEIQKKIFDILLEKTNYFKVGDPQQSIYLFRGAKSSIYEDEFKATENNLSVEQMHLNINYRSNKNLLLGINELFEHIDSKNFRPMVPRAEEIPSNDHSKRIKLYVNLNEEQELSYVVDLIKERISCGVSPGDICILSRTKALLYRYEAELQKHSIPSVLMVSGNFENRQEIREVLHFISFLEDPHLDEHLFYIMRSKSFFFNSQLLVKIFNKYKSSNAWSLWDFLNKEDDFSCTMLDSLKAYLDLYDRSGLVSVLKKYFFESTLLRSAKEKSDLNRRQSNLYKLYVEILAESVDSVHLSDTLKAILSKKIKSQSSEAVFSSSNVGVKLLTIHGSKGLEFDEVIVVGGHKKGSLSYTESIEIDSQGNFVAPFSDILKNIKVSGPLPIETKKIRISGERQETLRQIYVAATRARNNLYFFGQKKPWDNSIYKNFKLENASDFKFIEIIDPKNDFQDKKNVVERDWDVDKYSNFIKTFDKVFVSSSALSSKSSVNSLNQQKTKMIGVGNFCQINTGTSQVVYKSKALVNISVTDLVNLIYDKKIKLNYKSINQESFLSFSYDRKVLDSFDKILLGQLFHRYMELYAKNYSFEELDLKFRETSLGDMSSLSSSVMSMLNIKKPNMVDIFNNCNVEWGFNSLIGNKFLISGQIDLWGTDTKGDVHIIDYKSGSSAAMDKATIQVAIYRDVLKKLKPSCEIHTHLLFMSEGKFITVDPQFIINDMI